MRMESWNSNISPLRIVKSSWLQTDCLVMCAIMRGTILILLLDCGPVFSQATTTDNEKIRSVRYSLERYSVIMRLARGFLFLETDQWRLDVHWILNKPSDGIVFRWLRSREHATVSKFGPFPVKIRRAASWSALNFGAGPRLHVCQKPLINDETFNFVINFNWLRCWFRHICHQEV